MELVVARIGRPQGLRGEVSVEVRTDDPGRRFVVGAELRTDPVTAGPLRLASVRDQSGRTILRFDGIADRTQAEGLRGVLLVVETEDDGPDRSDEWYDHELVGLSAVDPGGTSLGTVVRLEHRPAQDLLVVRTPEAAEVLVPFVSALVPEVDVKAGRIVIDPPGGLFDDDGDV
ncbi:MAG: ribosome maturation factor RimM [Actinomycetales bacterium]|jgi:16S rRNA processing protein RimM